MVQLWERRLMKTSVVGSFFKRAQVGNVVTVWPPQCHPNNELVCLRQQTMPSAIFSFDKCWLVWIFSALGHYLTKSSKWTPFKTIDKFIPDFNSMSLTRPSICVNQEFIQLNPAIYNPEMVVEKYFNQYFFHLPLITQVVAACLKIQKDPSPD